MTTPPRDSHAPTVSVITATWNRAHLLARCFASLCQQATLPLEWIVVDDGSTDATPDVLAGMARSAPFAVQCLRQPNAGKHRAVNLAAAAVRGDLALILDSDDRLTVQAVAVIQRNWREIPEDARAAYAGLVGHSADSNGVIIGRPFPSNGESVPPLRLFHSDRVQGDKLFVHRAELLKQHPFPTFSGEKFLSEGIVWDVLRKSYRYRLLHEALQIVEYQTDGLSATSLSTRVRNPAGARAYYQQLSSLDIPWGRRMRSLINELRFAKHGGVRSTQALAESSAPLASALLLPLGMLAAQIDRVRLRARRDMKGSP